MLDYLDVHLTRSQRREVAKMMSQYNNLGAIIESRQADLIPSKVADIKDIAVQESNEIRSEADKYLQKALSLDAMVETKRKLDAVYNRAKPLHKLIWDEHFIDGRMDADIYYGNDITKRTYYREKNELMLVVAACLEIGTNLHHERTM